MKFYENPIFLMAISFILFVIIAVVRNSEFSNNANLVLLILAITSTEALGQFMLQLYHQKEKKGKKIDTTQMILNYFGIKTKLKVPLYPLSTWFLYGICTVMLLDSYKYTTMGKAEVYWDALSALLVPFIGVVMFHNDINSIGWIGIIMVLVGTLLLGFSKKIKKDIS